MGVVALFNSYLHYFTRDTIWLLTYLVSYEVSVTVTINKFNLSSGGKKIITTFIATSGNNGTGVSCIAYFNKMTIGHQM